MTKNQRRDAKVVNFGVMYGLSTHGLVEATGMSYEQAKHFIERYFEVRPKLRDYIESVKTQAKEKGYVENLLGRRRPTPDVNSSNFMEWMFTGVVNKNKGHRSINVNGNDFTVNSSYHNYQAGARINLGQYSETDTWTFSLIETLRYNLAYNPAYNEYDSVAALNVSSEKFSNLLTVGGGIRLSFPGEDPWLTGSREIRVMGTYDVISPNNTTYANFIVGSENFAIANPISPWGVEIGADFAITLCKRLQVQLSYDFTLRNQYTNNSGSIKLKYLF